MADVFIEKRNLCLVIDNPKTYELGEKENPYNKITHMFAHYAENANIGGNKTAAYGQTSLH